MYRGEERLVESGERGEGREAREDCFISHFTSSFIHVVKRCVFLHCIVKS